MRLLLILIAITIGVSEVRAQPANRPLSAIAHIHGGKSGWALDAVDGKWYFIQLSETDRKPTDQVVEKTDRFWDRIEIGPGDSGRIVTRFGVEPPPREYLAVDSAVDPPTLFWQKGPAPDDALWVFEPTKEENRYYMKRAASDSEQIWVSVGDPSKPRNVLKSLGGRVREMRPAVLLEKRRDVIAAVPRPTAK